jgi:hypothetical protein
MAYVGSESLAEGANPFTPPSSKLPEWAIALISFCAFLLVVAGSCVGIYCCYQKRDKSQDLVYGADKDEEMNAALASSE